MAEEKNLKIALITEDQGIQEYMSLILVGENYDVKTYFTQEEALAGLGGYLPDLVISDFQSPHINGMDICKALRRNYMFVHTPLIFILEETGPLTVGKVIYSGADDYLQKSTIEGGIPIKGEVESASGYAPAGCESHNPSSRAGRLT